MSSCFSTRRAASGRDLAFLVVLLLTFNSRLRSRRLLALLLELSNRRDFGEEEDDEVPGRGQLEDRVRRTDRFECVDEATLSSRLRSRRLLALLELSNRRALDVDVPGRGLREDRVRRTDRVECVDGALRSSMWSQGRRLCPLSLPAAVDVGPLRGLCDTVLEIFRRVLVRCDSLGISALHARSRAGGSGAFCQRSSAAF